MKPAFEPRSYWERRLSDRYGLHGVGYDGLGRAFNAWMYQVRREVFLSAARPVCTPSARVLDVGSGTGFYVERWQELGPETITGSDLAQVAVDRLRERFPQNSFERYDLGSGDVPFRGEFEVISAMDVLFHVVDDDQYRRAIAELASLLRPGGHLILSENFLHRRAVRMTHQASRPLDQIVGWLGEAGLVPVVRRPMFVLMNSPIDVPWLRLWWKGLHKVLGNRERLGDLAGRALFPMEMRLVRSMREGPSTELMLCRLPA